LNLIGKHTLILKVKILNLK